jgi:hypothetical protein
MKSSPETIKQETQSSQWIHLHSFIRKVGVIFGHRFVTHRPIWRALAANIIEYESESEFRGGTGLLLEELVTTLLNAHEEAKELKNFRLTRKWEEIV